MSGNLTCRQPCNNLHSALFNCSAAFNLCRVGKKVYGDVGCVHVCDLAVSALEVSSVAGPSSSSYRYESHIQTPVSGTVSNARMDDLNADLDLCHEFPAVGLAFCPLSLYSHHLPLSLPYLPTNLLHLHTHTTMFHHHCPECSVTSQLVT